MGRPKKIQPCEACVESPRKRTRREIDIEIGKLRVDIAEAEAFVACTRADIEKLCLEYKMAEDAATDL